MQAIAGGLPMMWNMQALACAANFLDHRRHSGAAHAGQGRDGPYACISK
jgi:hypothetical protein